MEIILLLICYTIHTSVAIKLFRMVKSKEENGQSDFSVNLDQDFLIKLSTTKKAFTPGSNLDGVSECMRKERR